MKEDLGVRIIRESGATGLSNPAGKVIFPPMMLREQLQKRGLIEPVEPVSKGKIVRK